MVHAYIPQDVWYLFPSGVKVKDVGVYTDLAAPLEKINVHVRGGFIIPMQIPGTNLMAGRGNPFTLLVAQSSLKNATGNLFWDDGDSIGEWIAVANISNTPFLLSPVDSIETKAYNYFEFSLVPVSHMINESTVCASLFISNRTTWLLMQSWQITKIHRCVWNSFEF